MTDRTALILLAAGLTTLAAAMTAAATGLLARIDHATWPQAIARAALAFSTTLSLASVLVTMIFTLAR